MPQPVGAGALGAEGNARMDSIRLRRIAALIGSAALLASMTVATAAAPASAGKCLPYENGDPMVAPNCYYAIERVVGFPVPPGVTLNGTNEVDKPGEVFGTFNGRGGADEVFVVSSGTVNGGKGDDLVVVVAGGTLNGGPGDDLIARVYADGTFNGGPGDDCAATVGSNVTGSDGTFAGGGGSDTYVKIERGDVWSAEQAGSCPF